VFRRFFDGRVHLPGLTLARPLILLAAAIALASYAQYAINRRHPGWASPLDRLNEEMLRIYGNYQSVALAFFLFVAAGVLFVLAGRGREDRDEPTPGEGPSSAELSVLARGGVGSFAIRLAVVGVVLWAYLIGRLAFGDYEEWYPYLFWAALLATAATFLTWDVRRGVRFRLHVRWWEVVLLIGLISAFVGLNVRDLDGWRYSFIGDEGAFMQIAMRIDNGPTMNVFSQGGVYGYHPVADSVSQAMVMKVFGFNYFGWKLASVLGVAVALPPFYFLVRMLFGLRPALFATMFMAASHYLFAYAHTGYNNVFSIFPVVLAFALFFAAMRSSSLLLLFGSGLASGMGFYTFFSARVAIVILALVVLSLSLRRWRWSLILPPALGFIIVVVPIFAVDRWEVIDAMLDQSAGVASQPLLKQMAENIPRALFAFNYNPNQGHYVAGALMDAASAVLAVLGLSYVVFRVRSLPFQFLLIWLGVAFVATGLFTRHQGVPFTRMQIVLPVMAAFAGLGAHRIVLVLEGTSRRVKLKPYTAVVTFAVLAPLVFMLNIERFWGDSAAHSPTTGETIAVRAVLEGPCEARPETVVVTDGWSPFFDFIFSTYELGERTPTVVDYAEVSSRDLADAPCIVLTQPESPKYAALVKDLERDYPSRRLEEMTDMAHFHRIHVFR
jgi:4-amino-4-deoxy-L-arabinose transferase-like glycosyltransferase